MLLHRKNDKRDASSRSLMRYIVPGAAFAGSGSVRNRNFGSVRISRSAFSIPASKLAFIPALLIEAEQDFEIGVRHRPAISAAREG